MSAERREAIFKRLPDLSPGDQASLAVEIDRYVAAGWTDSDIVRWCKCTEEVTPSLSEERALRKMREITYQVEQRLKGEKMIRFVDLTPYYWLDSCDKKPICAFLSTSDDKFVTGDDGSHTFSDFEDVQEIKPDYLRKRCLALLPGGFFT
jgi:hypothetical protein